MGAFHSSRRALARPLFVALFVALSLSSALAKTPCSVSLVNTNAENFFDWVPNNRVEDWSYRDQLVEAKLEEAEAKGNPPSESASWNEEHFQAKLKNFLAFVKEVGSPDILVSVEIENENVAHKIAAAAGYDSIFLTKGHDPRGINIVVFVRENPNLKVTSMALHDQVGREFAGHPTRQILEVQFLVGGSEKLILFANHWPSQMGPTKARHAAAKRLWTEIRDRMEEDPDARIIATGDFNTVENEKQPSVHPFGSLLLDPNRSGHLVDVHEEFMTARGIPKARKQALPPGSYYYIPRSKSKPREWNRFDRFLVSQNMIGKKGLHVDVPSYDIKITEVSSQLITDPEGKEQTVPMSFNPVTGKGVTDHFPTSVTLKVN